MAVIVGVTLNHGGDKQVDVRMVLVGLQDSGLINSWRTGRAVQVKALGHPGRLSVIGKFHRCRAVENNLTRVGRAGTVAGNDNSGVPVPRFRNRRVGRQADDDRYCTADRHRQVNGSADRVSGGQGEILANNIIAHGCLVGQVVPSGHIIR